MQLLRHPHRQVRPKLLRLREPHRDRPRLQRPGHGGRGRRHRGVTRQRRRGEVELPHQLLNRRLRRRRGHRRPRRRRRPSSPLLLLPRHLSNPPNPHEATRSTRRPFSLPPSPPHLSKLHSTPPPPPIRRSRRGARRDRGRRRQIGGKASPRGRGWRGWIRRELPTRACLRRRGREWRISERRGVSELGISGFSLLLQLLSSPSSLSFFLHPLSFSSHSSLSKSNSYSTAGSWGRAGIGRRSASGPHPAARIHRR